MKKVIIIGAGPAGLTAAYELLRRNKNEFQVKILEESHAVGGISKTVSYHGNHMDIGGHRFFSKDQEVTDWWEQMMPSQGQPSYDDKVLHRTASLTPGGPDPEKEDQVMLRRKRVSRIYYKHRFFDYPVSLKLATLKNMGLATTAEVGVSYATSMIHKLPETSLENFYINRFGKKLYSMFFEDYTEKLWGRHPRDISADWGAQRVKGLSVVGIIKDMIEKTGLLSGKNPKTVETSLIEEFSYPKYGPGQLWETAAKKIVDMGGIIELGSCVSGLCQDADGNITGVRYQNGEQLQEEMADIVISTMPVKDLISGMCHVPERISHIANGLPYRDFVTIGLLVDKLYLNNETSIKTLNNIVPDCWIYVQDAGVKLGRIQIFNNWSPYMVQDPEHTVWIGLEYFCKEGDDFWNMPEKDCIHYAILELGIMGILKKASQVKDAHREQVKKAYPAYFDTYQDMGEVIDYLNQFENLYCIGRNGQHHYNNMDHSMATAFAAVRHICGEHVDKNQIWNINTEKEYHEEKTTD